MTTTPKLDNPLEGGSSPPTCSRLGDLVPPLEIIEASGTLSIWMERMGYRRWRLNNTCARLFSDEADNLREALRAAEPHMRHGLNCDARAGGFSCTCGMQEAWMKVRDAVSSANAELSDGANVEKP